MEGGGPSTPSIQRRRRLYGFRWTETLQLLCANARYFHFLLSEFPLFKR